jgi:DNA-binding transcriptional LysR family regulator
MEAAMPLRHATLRQLRVFEAAARHLSFSRAAAELHLTQPGVSMHVKELEGSAGLPLFERLGRRLYVTAAGQELLARTREILGALDDAGDALDALRGLRGGRIDLAVTSTAKYFAPQLLARFREQHAAVAVRLVVSNREAVIAALTGNSVDLAIMGRPPEAPRTEGIAFARHPFVIVAAPDHPLARRRRLPVSALAGETFLVREPGSGTRTAMQQFVADQHADFRIGMEMSSNETIKQAVIAGLGVSFISRHTVGLELATEHLVALDVRGLPVIRQWFVVRLAAKRLAPTPQAFETFVKSHGRRILAAQFGSA